MFAVWLITGGVVYNVEVLIILRVCVFKDALIKKKANWGRCYGQTKAYLVQQQLPSTEIKVHVISCNTNNRTPTTRV